MSHIDIIDKDGTPKSKVLLAVFNDESSLRTAASALSAQNIEAEPLRGSVDADRLDASDGDNSTGNRFTRWWKGFGGEDLEAKRYAVHLNSGRPILAMHCEDQGQANGLTALLTEHGAFDITYFGDWMMQHMSPGENAENGMPTYESTTEPDDYTLGNVTPGAPR